MRQKQIIEEMALLAEKLGLNIKFDEFDGRGGWCRVKDSQRIIINKRLGPQEQIRILSQILAGLQIEEQSMAPKVRQLIEEAREEMQPALDISDKNSKVDTNPEK
jgi:hypothetical protein